MDKTIGWMFTSMDRALPDVGHDAATLDVGLIKALTDRLLEAGRYISSEDFIFAPPDRAASFHYFLEMLSLAVDRGAANADPYRPLFSRPWDAHLRDWGGASPDSVYRHCTIRGDVGYRLHGTLGNAKSIAIQIFAGNDIVDTIQPADLSPDGDGNFEIWIGGTERPVRWRPLALHANYILTREFFDNWLGAHRSHLRIACTADRAPNWPIQSTDRVAAEFEAIGRWIVRGAFEFWGEREKKNRARRDNGFDGFTRTDGLLPALSFGSMTLGAGEVLVLELENPRADFWGMQLCDFWTSTLDYANCLTTFNCAQARPDPDGVFRFVVSAKDPGFYNWFDTTGLERGVFIYRVVGGRHLVPPSVRMIPTSDLHRALPHGRRVSPAERRQQIEERREGVAHMVLD
jgi:hypothetical protein